VRCRMSPHEEFLALCAASTSGELSDEERRKLDEHLSGCASCRQALKQYQETVQMVIPRMATELMPSEPAPDPSWSPDQAEKALFNRLAQKDSKPGSQRTDADPINGSEPSHYRAYLRSRFDWRQMWMSYVAAILLFLAFAISAYRVGVRKGFEVAKNTPAAPKPGGGALEEQLADLGHERETLRAALAASDQTIDELKQQVERLRSAQGGREAPPVSAPSEKERSLAEEAASAKAGLADLQGKLEAEQKARSEESARVATLETKLNTLTEQLHDRDETAAAQNQRLESRQGTIEQQQAKLGEQQDLLDHDRDIRELMGARDLYVADVLDVSQTGATQKSYGRVFYTKGKSLVFYAFDLDRQPGLKKASSFQAWGQRGPDRNQALNLGILYEDNVAKKRWVLKFDDAKNLDQIEAVFVTVEPNGGSAKPTGKAFLSAYLRVAPNHP
jgi:hypothetical protein